MVMTTLQFLPKPEIGLADVAYQQAISQAEAESDVHKRAALKVTRYITLALNPKLPWPEKVRYLSHALKHYCAAPAQDEETLAFYRQLTELVREHCGAEALRLASQEDEMYATRLALGQERIQIDDEADAFFTGLLGIGDGRPNHFSELDWAQLKMIRDQWI